jgi:hypothetical protein
MTPENLSRSLAGLAKHGVSIKGRIMIITDLEALRRWAKGEISTNGSAAGNSDNEPANNGGRF